MLISRGRCTLSFAIDRLSITTAAHVTIGQQFDKYLAIRCSTLLAHPPHLLLQQKTAIVLIDHAIPEVEAILFRIHTHRQFVCYVQVGDVQTTLVRAVTRVWRPHHGNVVVVPGADRGSTVGKRR